MELGVWDSQATAAQQTATAKSSTTRSRPNVQLTEDNYLDTICFLEDFGTIVCKTHCTAVVNLDTHLRDQHHTPVKLRKVIVKQFSQFSQTAPDAIELPEQPASVVEELGTPLDGFKCRTCEFVTINSDSMRKHCKKNHSLSWKGSKSTLYKDVKVQSLFRIGGLQKYFIVDCGEGAKEKKSNHDQDDQVVQQQLGEYQKVRQQIEDDMQVMEEAVKTDKTGWFKRTGWLPFLKGRNLAHLGYIARLPDRNEAKLQLAAELAETLIEQSVKGLASLPRETRRWLRSAKQAEADQRPLARLQNPESQATYTGYIVRFVCFYLRIIADEERRVDDFLSQQSGVDDSSDRASSEESSTESEYDDSDKDNKAGSTDNDSIAPARTPRKNTQVDKLKDARELFRWKGDQKALAMQLWLMLDDGDATAQIRALLESLTSFMLTDYGNNELSTGLMQYLAVLGIDTQTNRLRTAKNYSYMLAGVVYCTRVLAVEKLLPAAERDNQSEEDRDQFLEMRKKYLADGSYSPMSAMISLLAYSKHAAMNEGNAGNTYWSADKKTFYLNGRPIVVERFRKMAQSMEAELVERFWQLCWVDNVGDRFTIRLEQVTDDVTFTTRGKSFVTTASNDLSQGLAWMLGRARSTEGGMRLQTPDGWWRSKKVREYLRELDRVKELMLGCVHVEQGQPARGSEILTMRHRNGLLQDRNLFVIGGTMVSVIRYYKSQSQYDAPKVVPRFLPPRLGQIMALYLSYLQPFEEYLIVQVLGGGVHDYIWGDSQGAWSTDRLTRVLKRETGKRLGVELHTLGYRHTAVGIGRVKVGESFGRGYQDEVGEIDEAEVDEDQEDLLELQNARTTMMGVGNYSVSIDIVKHLSTRSIDAFRVLSTAWHRFLGVDGQAMEHDEPRLQRKRRMRESISGLAMLPKEKAVQVEDRRATAVQRALQKVLGKQDVGFRSVEQEQALNAVLDKQTPLVVILPTGGGKSLLFTVPACVEEVGVTVVVVPYRALIEDLVSRISSAGVDCIE